jgi:hypothetical protein
MRQTRALVFTAVVIGCGSSGGEDLGGDRSELRIDMRPVDAMRWYALFEVEDPQRLRSADSFPLAWGDDYPRTLDVTLDEAWSPCGSLDGTFTLDSVVTQDDGLDVVVTAADAFRLAPALEGDFSAVVRGTFAADSGEECVGAGADVELTLTVSVRRPVGIAIDPPQTCDESDRFRVESDAHLAPSAYVHLVDAEGAVFDPRNAAATHPATLTLEADEDTALALHTPDEGFAALVVSGAPGPISVSAFDEEQAILDHVAPAAITVVGAQFQLLGFGGGPTLLSSGQVYGEQGWSRTSASIGVATAGLEVDGEQICTLPRAEGFVLASSTPQTCTAYAELGHGDGPFGAPNAVVPVSGEVIASGICTLRLDGPEYSGGAGFSTELSVEIQNADSLFHIEGR